MQINTPPHPHTHRPQNAIYKCGPHDQSPVSEPEADKSCDYDTGSIDIEKRYSIGNHCLMWNGYPRKEIRLDDTTVKALMRKKGAWICRNLYDFDCSDSTNFWEIICDKPFEIEDLPSKVRNQVRRCVKDCEIRHLTNIELINADGYNVYLLSYERYHDIIKNPVTREVYESKLKRDSHLDIYGVFRKEDNLCIAYAWNVIDHDVVKYSALKAIPQYLNKHYPFYGLLYVMTRDYLNNGYTYVTDGFRSLTGHSNIQPFLEQKFRFRKAYCKINITYVWWLKLFINLVFPFKSLITNSKLSVLLNMEQIRRE